MKRLTVRSRLTLGFAGAVLATLICFGVAVTVVLWLDESREQSQPGAQAEGFDDVRQAALAMLAVSPVALAAAVGIGPPARAPRHRPDARGQPPGPRRSPVRGRGSGGAGKTRLGQLPRPNSLNADARASLMRIQYFTADAAHELRNPVTTILGEADLALRNRRCRQMRARPGRRCGTRTPNGCAGCSTRSSRWRGPMRGSCRRAVVRWSWTRSPSARCSRWWAVGRAAGLALAQAGDLRAARCAATPRSSAGRSRTCWTTPPATRSRR